MYHFCTYFDKNYLLRGITLYRSLRKHCEMPFCFYVLCLDQETFDVLDDLGEDFIIPLRLNDVESWDKELLVAKENRSLIEYYFTLSPVLPLYILENFDVDIIAYLDADLMFFSSPKAIYDELGESSILIVEHRFPEKLKEMTIHGRFNVQCQVFRDNNVGLKCLHYWRDQCIKWCYDRLEDGKFADQKYLDEWPELYADDLMITKHLGIGLAPWNIGDSFVIRKNKVFFVEGNPLVFFHFHGLKIINHHLIRTGVGGYQARLNRELRELYCEYMKSMQSVDIKAIAHEEIRFGQGKCKTFLLGVKYRDLLWIRQK